VENDEIQKRIGQRQWFHSIEVAPGVVTPGQVPAEYLDQMLQRVAFPERLDGMTVLDVGAWDGFFSFEAERRGAARVVAYDLHPADFYGFNCARDLRGSKVEYIRGSVYDLSPEMHGTFDVVLFFGILYHLRYPLLALDRLRAVTGQYMLFESHHLDNRLILEGGHTVPLASIDPRLSRIGLFQFYREDQLGGDFSNWFAPNRRAIEDSLWSAGFRPEFLEAWNDRVAYRALRMPGRPEYQLDSYEGLQVETGPDGSERWVLPTRKDAGRSSSK
jgi:tRNA (mo5U34)-methyltransferase